MHKRIAGRNGLSVLISCVVCLASADLAGQSAPVTTRKISLKGHTVRVRSAGLDRRHAGTPVVVFEAGATNSLEVWDQVLPRVAEFAPVVSYDRAGLGESDWDSQDPTPEHVNERLRELLSTIGAEPPYVLVGFSWGGALMRYFAGRHPPTVAGVVYVDPGPIVTQTRAEELAPFVETGAGERGRDAFWDTFAALSARGSPAVQAEFRVFRGLIDREVAERGLLPAPHVPTVVIVAAKYEALPLQLPYDPAVQFQADTRHRIKMLADWLPASPYGTLVVANNSGHVVPKDDPELVIWAVRRVLDSGRSP